MKQFYWVDVTYSYLACASNRAEAVDECDVAISDASNPDEISVHEVDLESVHLDWSDSPPYGEPYYDDDPDLTVREIVARMKKEKAELDRVAKLDALQVKMFEDA